jgi:hypothetical protein
MRQTENREWLQVQIPAELKHSLRVKAAQDKETMTTCVEAVLRLYVSGQITLDKEGTDHPDTLEEMSA